MSPRNGRQKLKRRLFRAAAVASMPQRMMAGLMRREGETWDALLLRLNEAVMQSVVENRVISELRL